MRANLLQLLDKDSPDPDVLDDLNEKERSATVKAAKIIVRDGWLPAMFMIDKDAGERNAIQKGMSPSLLLNLFLYLSHTSL